MTDEMWRERPPTDGHRLVLGSDAGGRRWFLDGQPVHAGTGLELCIEVERSYRDRDDVELFRYGWLRVRLEFDFHEGRALIHIGAPGLELKAVANEYTLFRWPCRCGERFAACARHGRAA